MPYPVESRSGTLQPCTASPAGSDLDPIHCGVATVVNLVPPLRRIGAIYLKNTYRRINAERTNNCSASRSASDERRPTMHDTRLVTE